MRLVKSLVLVAAVGLTFAPRPASATSYRFGLGADYWFEKSGLFQANFAVYEPVLRRFSVGGRFGLAYVTDPSTGALPIDLVLHGDIGPMYYLEGVVGPWIFFKGDTVRAHVGGGFGFHTRHLSIGFELAYLDPNALLGVRLSFPL